MSTSSSDLLEIAQKAPPLGGFLASLVTDQKKTLVRADLSNRRSGGNDAGWRIFGGSSLVAAG